MNGINGLIHYVHDRGWGQLVYNSATPVVYTAVLVYLLLSRKKYGISLRQAITAAVITIMLTPMLTTLLAWISNGFENFDGGNILRTFTFFPLVILLNAKLLKVPPGIMLDYMTPVILIWNAIGQSVCPFLGCCAGIPCSWGIWNPFLDEMVFPIQWLISLSVLGVLWLVLRHQKRHDYDGNGNAYPMMLVVYGVIRFFLEFLKRREPLFLGISELMLHALLMALVGTVWLFTKEEIERENKRKAGWKRQRRGIYSPTRANIGYPKEDKI